MLCVPASPAWGGTSRLRGGSDVTVNDYGFLVDGELPEMSYDATTYLDLSMHDKYMFLASSSLLYWAAAPTTSIDTNMQDCFPPFVGDSTETRTCPGLSLQSGAASGNIPLHGTISSCVYGMAFGRVNYFLRFLDSRLHVILSLRVLAAPPWGGTF